MQSNPTDPNQGMYAGPVGDSENNLNVLVWPGYAEDGSTDPKVDWVSDFEKQTGCKVNSVYAGTSLESTPRVVESVMGEFRELKANPIPEEHGLDKTFVEQKIGRVPEIELGRVSHSLETFPGERHRHRRPVPAEEVLRRRPQHRGGRLAHHHRDGADRYRQSDGRGDL